jgi:hypothetical protein
MNQIASHLNRRMGLPYLLAILAAGNCVFCIAQDAAGGSQEAIAILAAENGLVGYDHRKHVQKQLLEFAKPMYKEPLVSAQLISSLSTIGYNEVASAERRQAADRINMATAGTANLELQSRLFEQSTKMQTLAQSGISTPGARSINRASDLAAKGLEINERMANLDLMVKYLDKKIQSAAAMKKLRVDNRLRMVQESKIVPVIAKSGKGLNTLLSAIEQSLNKESPGDRSAIFETSRSDLPPVPNDLLKWVRLQLETETGPIIFDLLDGNDRLGKAPVAMKHPDLKQTLDEVEPLFRELSEVESDEDLYKLVRDGHTLLDQIEEISLKAIGSATANAKKGHAAHLSYKQAKSYRDHLRQLLNRVELQGDASVLKAPLGKFVPKPEGTPILDLISYVVDSGCMFAPAKTGGEAAYAQLQRALLEANIVLSE